MIAVVPGPGLLFGLVLMTAMIGGYLARLVRTPRVVGFLVGGVALHLILKSLLDVSDQAHHGKELIHSAETLGGITNLALGLILFTIGGVFERSKLRSGGMPMLKQSLVEISLVALLVFSGCTAFLFTFASDQSVSQRLVLASLLAVSSIATAPAATLFVLQEYEAKGPVTERILGLTGLNNVVCIVSFFSLFLILSSLGAINLSETITHHTLLTLFCTTLGSVILGVVAGSLISILHAKWPLAETLLLFFAFFILLGAGEPWLWKVYGLSYNFLLTSLVMGAVFTNVAIDSQRLEDTLRTVGTPLFAGFFVLAGFNLHIEEFLEMGLLGAAYMLSRTAGKVIGCRIGARWSAGSSHDVESVGSALWCQAAVVIGLCAFVNRSGDQALASQFSAVLLGSVVVFELIGPLMVKRCVIKAGEVKAITLLHRASVSTEGASIVRITLQSLRRMFIAAPQAASHAETSLYVQHIMRTNVQFLHASTTFDETLHFIERSTHTHFTVVHENGDYAGVIHFADVRDVIYDPSLCQLITAEDLVDPDSPTVPEDMTLNDLFDVFTGSNLTVLPVVEKAEHKRIVGIVEQRDLLRALHLSPNRA